MDEFGDKNYYKAWMLCYRESKNEIDFEWVLASNIGEFDVCHRAKACFSSGSLRFRNI